VGKTAGLTQHESEAEETKGPLSDKHEKADEKASIATTRTRRWPLYNQCEPPNKNGMFKRFAGARKDGKHHTPTLHSAGKKGGGGACPQHNEKTNLLVMERGIRNGSRLTVLRVYYRREEV